LKLEIPDLKEVYSLNIQNMLKNHHLAKSISDVAWGMLVKATESKAAYAGSKVVLVDPKYNDSQKRSL